MKNHLISIIEKRYGTLFIQAETEEGAVEEAKSRLNKNSKFDVEDKDIAIEYLTPC